jgi:hypothetical protein
MLFEVAGRLMIASDIDGNQSFRERPLYPERFPILSAERSLREYREKLRTTPSVVNYVYDAGLGWVGNPLFRNGEYRNSQGIRAHKERVFSEQPQEGVLRIALFGDSFTQSSPVAIEESWGFLLEAELNRSGIPCEVLNFGVGGYGIDQAYLRWKLEGRGYHPDIVILGFYALDVRRCLRIFSSSGNVLSKPIFRLEGGRLELHNSPTVPIDAVVDELRRLPDSRLGRLDYYLEMHRDDYQSKWWRYSMSGRLCEMLLRDLHRRRPDRFAEYLDPQLFPAQLAASIIRTFNREARREGSRFYVVSIPARFQLQRMLKGHPSVSDDLLESLQREMPVIRTEDALIQEARAIGMEQLYVPDGHNAKAAEEVLGKQIAAEILKEHRAAASIAR